MSTSLSNKPENNIILPECDKMDICPQDMDSNISSKKSEKKKPYKKGQIHKFLEEYRVLKSGAFTHTSLGEPLGSYYLPFDKEKEFHKLYEEALLNNEPLYLTEKHKYISPILIDLDLRYTGDLVRLYTKENKYDIVNTYIDILKEYYDMEDKKIYVMEKPNPSKYKDEINKDGLHIIIPDIITQPLVQYYIRDKFIDKMKDYFKNIGYTNDIADIFDKAVIEKNNWLMYGSTKPNSEIYKVSEVYKLKNDKLEEVKNTNLTLHKLIDLFSIRNKNTENVIKFEKDIDIKEYRLKLESDEKKKNILAQATTKKKFRMNKNESVNIEFIKKVIGILDIKRAEQYDLWIKLGWCLRTIDYRLLEDWNEFSKKSSKYEEGKCEELWDNMKDTGLGIGTLIMWAKQDNKKEYDEIVRKDTRRFLEKAISKTDYDLAVVVYNMYKYDYVCSSIERNTWYKYRNHRWELIESGYCIRTHISTDIVNEYFKIIAEISIQIVNETIEQEDRDRLSEKAQKIQNIITALKSTSKKNNIMKESATLFYMEKFEDKLDSNPNLIGFKNGVYDLELMEFRDGHPDDFISFTTGINYIEYSEDNPYNNDVINFVSKVMPKEHLRNYLLTCLSSFLSGKIKEEKFHIWTGNGSNGKKLPFTEICCVVRRLLMYMMNII